MRKLAGIIFILIALCISVIPSLTSKKIIRTEYPGKKEPWLLTPVSSENKGSVRVNEADADELAELPGIGEKLAIYLVNERTENGPFYYAEDLESVRGIGPVLIGKIRDLIDLTDIESGE